MFNHAFLLLNGNSNMMQVYQSSYKLITFDIKQLATFILVPTGFFKLPL